MCGRFFLRPEITELLGIFGLDAPAELTLPRWNIPPTQQIPVVTAPDGTAGVQMHRWGLVPSWWKKDRLSTFHNARAETAASKPSFRSAFKRRRGLVPASGFYEWKRDGEAKQPFAIEPKAGPGFLFAALTSRHRRGETVLDTVTVLTTAAQGDVATLHDRQPLVLPEHAWATWMHDETSTEALQALLVPWTGTARLTPVGDDVNNARHTSGDWMVSEA